MCYHVSRRFDFDDDIVAVSVSVCLYMSDLVQFVHLYGLQKSGVRPKVAQFFAHNPVIPVSYPTLKWEGGYIGQRHFSLVFSAGATGRYMPF